MDRQFARSVTEFETGDKIIVNYGDSEQVYDEYTVEAKTYLVVSKGVAK